jgi:hypothetical protein
MASIVIAVALLVVACGPDHGSQGIVVQNRSGETVRVAYVVAGVEYSLEGEIESDTIPDDSVARYNFDLYEPGNARACTSGDIVIRGLDGREIDRFPPPICEGTSIPVGF